MIDSEGSELEHSRLTVGDKDNETKVTAPKCPMAAGSGSYKLSDQEIVDNAFQVLLAG